MGNNGMYDKFIKRGLLLAIFLIPFFFERKVGPAVVTSTEVLFFIIFLAWIIKLPRENLARTPPDFPIFTFLFLTTISFLYSSNMSSGIKELIQFIGIFLLYYFFVNNIEEGKEIKKIVLLLIISSSIVSVIALYQYFSRSGIVISPFIVSVASTFHGQPNALGAYLGMIIPLVSGLFIYSRGREKSLLGLVLPLLFLALFFTFSRSAWLGVIGSLVIILSFKKKKFFFFFLGGAALLLLFNFFSGATFLGKGLHFLLNLKGTSGQERILLSQAALKMMKDRPLFGVGPGNFLYLLPEYAPRLGRTNPLVHNFVLQLGAENGILALGAFFWLLVVYFREGWRNFRDDRWPGLSLGLLGSLIFILINSLFGYPFLHGIQEPFVLVLALTVVLKHRKKNEFKF
jgi:O-antigen ligase